MSVVVCGEFTRVSYFKNASKYLHPGGRIAIIDFNGQGWFTRLIGHWTPREAILQELQQAGYSLQQELTFLPNQEVWPLMRPVGVPFARGLSAAKRFDVMLWWV